MDFVIGFSNTPRGSNAIWVIVDRLTKSTYFISVKINFSLQKLAEIYISMIMKLHGISLSIIYGRDPRFTSRFWESYMRLWVLCRG